MVKFCLDTYDILHFRLTNADITPPHSIGQPLGLLLCLTYSNEVLSYHGR